MVKMLIWFQSSSVGVPRGAPSLERIIVLLVTAQVELQEVCAGSQPESSPLPTDCQKANEQMLPLSRCSLPSGWTCNLSRGCVRAKTGASGAAD